MPNDIQDWTQSVTVQGGTVTVASGTVTVSGTVNVGNVPSVVISGTASVNVGTVSGTVSITGPVSVSAGQAGVSVTTDSPPKLLATITNNGPGFVNTITPDPKATGLLIVVYPQTVGGTWTIKGGTSAEVYDAVPTPYDPGTTTFDGLSLSYGADLVMEGTFTISTSYAGGASTLAKVYEVYGAGVSRVVGSAGQPLPVALSESLDYPLKTARNGGIGMAVNAKLALITPVAGRTIVLYGIDLSITAAVVGIAIGQVMEHTSTVVHSSLLINAATLVGGLGACKSVSIPEGLPLTLGDGLDIQNVGAVAASILCEVRYRIR